MSKHPSHEPFPDVIGRLRVRNSSRQKVETLVPMPQVRGAGLNGLEIRGLTRLAGRA